MQITVRPARIEEFDDVGKLTLAGYQADGYLTGDEDYAGELLDAASRAAGAELLVAIDAQTGDLLGTVTFVLPGSPYAEISRPGEAEMRMLSVGPAVRRAGVGRTLVRSCIDRAEAAGARVMVLSTTHLMVGAHALYERMGFTRLPERDWQPAPHIRLLAYALPLNR